MKYKPKMTLKGQKALVYKRYNNLNSAKLSLPNITDNIINKYQINEYHYFTSFNFLISGNTNTTTTQFLKGNVMELTTLNIKYFDDYVKLKPSDLAVIDDRLFIVESAEYSHKHFPNDYNIYYATLNSVV